jgi:hypothetical protein
MTIAEALAATSAYFSGSRFAVRSVAWRCVAHAATATAKNVALTKARAII